MIVIAKFKISFSLSLVFVFLYLAKIVYDNYIFNKSLDWL
jgi:hypothetical protein